MIATADAFGKRTTVTLNAAGERTAITDALGRTTAAVYDAAGNRTATVDALGNRSTAVYDVLNRAVPGVDALGNRTTAMFDAVGNATGTIDPLGRRTTSGYDGSGRLTAYLDELGHQSTVAYDAVDNRLGGTDALGRRTSAAYNDLDRRTQWSDARGTAAYDAVGNLISNTDARGFTTTAVYDAVNRRIATVNALNQLNTVVYDAVGHAIASIDPLGHRNMAVYDAADRLVGTVELQLRLRQPFDGGDPERDGDGADHLRVRCFRESHRTAGVGRVDRDGRAVRARRLGHGQAWGGGQRELRHDLGFGCDEPRDDAAAVRRWPRRFDRSTQAQGTVAYYETDRQGSVQGLLDISGNVVGTLVYDGFGKVTTDTGSTDRYQYTAREFDSALGLMYSRARMYDAVSGRFFGVDQSGFSAGDPNLYRYVGNSPTNGRDPSGLDYLFEKDGYAYIATQSIGARKDAGYVFIGRVKWGRNGDRVIVPVEAPAGVMNFHWTGEVDYGALQTKQSSAWRGRIPNDGGRREIEAQVAAMATGGDAVYFNINPSRFNRTDPAPERSRSVTRISKSNGTNTARLRKALRISAEQPSFSFAPSTVWQRWHWPRSILADV